MIGESREGFARVVLNDEMESGERNKLGRSAHDLQHSDELLRCRWNGLGLRRRMLRERKKKGNGTEVVECRSRVGRSGILRGWKLSCLSSIDTLHFVGYRAWQAGTEAEASPEQR